MGRLQRHYTLNIDGLAAVSSTGLDGGLHESNCCSLCTACYLLAYTLSSQAQVPVGCDSGRMARLK